jgi:hypothetical protein
MKDYEIWRLQDFEKEIIEYLDKGKKAFIENGCLNDEIISYSQSNQYDFNRHYDDEFIFTTTASVFSREIRLASYSEVETEEFNGNLFVHVR